VRLARGLYNVPVRALSEGSLVAGYRVESFLAHGGMGVLYRATQLSLDRPVALKVIKPELAEDKDFRARFILESQIAASIDHPNVIPIHEADEADGVLFIAMRYVEGIDLARLIARQGALEPADALRIVSHVAAALDAAHTRGLVHRDVKPANVLVTGAPGGEHVYLTDFGLVKRSASPGGLTKTGEWVGTLDYVAPEQLKGDAVDSRADVYALGCLTYQALTGSVPYPRGEDVAKLWAHMHVAPPSLRDQAPSVPERLDEVVKRAMAKQPDDRYATAGEFSRAAAAAATTAVRRSGPVTQTAAAPPAAESQGRRWKGARAALAAVGVLAAVALAVVLLSGGDDGSEPESNAAGRVVGRPISVGSSPSQAVVGGGAVWVTNSDDGTVSRIDPGSNTVRGSPIRVGTRPVFLASDAGTIWVANSEQGSVTRIDARSNRVAATIDVGGAPLGIAAGEGGVWVADAQNNEVIRIDPASNQVDPRRIPVGELPFGVAAGAGAVWVTNTDDNTLTKIDPARKSVIGKPLFVGTAPGGVAIGEGGVWVANGKDDTVVRVVPDSFKVAGKPISVGRFPDSLTVGEGAIWVANEADDTLTRIDPETNRVVGRPIKVGRAPVGPGAGGGAVWVPNADDNTVSRIAP
jgi:YVTN family beta-propeller protein